MATIIDFIPKELQEAFFEEQKNKVMTYLHARFGASDEDAEEAYYNGCYALFEAIHQGTFTAEKGEDSVAAYILTCSRNQLLKIFEYQGRMIPASCWPKEGRTNDWVDDIEGTKEEQGPIDESDVEDKELIEADYRLMESIVTQHLPHPCEDLIRGKYYDNFSAAEMAERLGYRNSRVAITQLSRCMKKLRIYFNQMKKEVDNE